MWYVEGVTTVSMHMQGHTRSGIHMQQLSAHCVDALCMQVDNAMLILPLVLGLLNDGILYPTHICRLAISSLASPAMTSSLGSPQYCSKADAK